MSFGDAISSVFRQYVGFRGRARRSEYWWWVLFTVLLSAVVSALQFALGLADENGNGPLSGLLGLALLLPGLAVAVRRLHDTGRTGWWILIGLIPLIGWIVLIVFYVQDSAPGDNEHGPNPKGIGGPPYGAVGPAGYGPGPGTPQQPQG